MNLIHNSFNIWLGLKELLSSLKELGWLLIFLLWIFLKYLDSLLIIVVLFFISWYSYLNVNFIQIFVNLVINFIFKWVVPICLAIFRFHNILYLLIIKNSKFLILKIINHINNWFFSYFKFLYLFINKFWYKFCVNKKSMNYLIPIALSTALAWA